MNPRRRTAGRRALTFLEVVAAVALLGVVAASMLGLLGFISGGQSRQAQQLAAAELANRLILMYLDDPTAMPAGREPIRYGPAQFRWEYQEDPITLTEAKPEGRQAGRTQSPLDNNRFSQITMRVWLSERSGGSRRPEQGAPAATLTRFFDPIALRNPDSGENLLSNPARMQEFMNRMMGLRGGSGGTTPPPDQGAERSRGGGRR